MVFFILVFLMFFLSVKLAKYVIGHSNMPNNAVYILVGIIHTLILVSFYYLAKLHGNNKEGFWDVSDYAQCKGGPYFWQGDSETAKMCRQFAETPEGRCGISSYNCPTGFVGTPKQPFYYTPLSDDQWKNEQCEDKPNCPCEDTGLCGMVKQVE
jgi:hypothetical protein